ncbi:hypothetical protein HaLaN_24021, partial [Haematococcus lacustris]
LMLVLNAMQHLTNMLRPHQVDALDKLLMQSGDSLAATAGPEEGTIML